jgi:hypothetical protein
MILPAQCHAVATKKSDHSVWGRDKDYPDANRNGFIIVFRFRDRPGNHVNRTGR